MEAAIQWLPTIGAGILLTVAITAWFTPDRQLVAVWFGFAGLCLLLLTGALQLHVYVATSILQPKIDFSPPPAPSHFRWDAAQSFVPVLKAPNDQLLPGGSASPLFTIANSSPILAADLSIEWTAPPIDADRLNAMSPQFAKYVRNILPGSFQLVTPMPPPNSYATSFPTRSRTRMSIPFLNRPVDTFLPYEVFSAALPILMTKLPDHPGHAEFDIEFGAVVTWNIPDRGTPQRFILVAHVRNTKQGEDHAIMDADIDWSFKRAEH